MSSFVRASKFRHVYSDPPKPEFTYQNLRLSPVTGEANYIKANPLFFAVGLAGGGGPIGIVPLSKHGRLDMEKSAFVGHSAYVLDFEFNPFHDHVIASGSEDMSIKVWGIPEGGLTSTIKDPLIDLPNAHGKRVSLLRFHPTASNVLASAGGDNVVKVWDIEKGAEISRLDPLEQLIQDVVWDYTGAVYATSCKDKNVRIVDPRANRVAAMIDTAHEGAKSTKLTFTGSFDKLITIGFTRQSQRQFKIWDPRNTSEELKKVEIDQAAGVLMPFFDADTGLLYLAGKGDGNIRYYEIVNEPPHYYVISETRSTVAAKGMAWVPKRGVNVSSCEIARLLKLTTNSVEPLSFIVPRKSEAFQEDLYPDTASCECSHTADSWMAGANLPPKLMSLNPAESKASGSSSGSAPSASIKAFTPMKTPAILQAELDAANARIKVLEARLAAAGLSTD